MTAMAPHLLSVSNQGEARPAIPADGSRQAACDGVSSIAPHPHRTRGSFLMPRSPSPRRGAGTLAVPLLVSAAVLALIPGAASAAPPGRVPHSQTFTYTGSAQDFVVPAGVTSLTLTVDGASGGDGESTSGDTPGGKGRSGGRIVETVVVHGGQHLRIAPGGAGQAAAAPAGAGSGGRASGGASNGGSGGFGGGKDTTHRGRGGGGGGGGAGRP